MTPPHIVAVGFLLVGVILSSLGEAFGIDGFSGLGIAPAAIGFVGLLLVEWVRHRHGK